MTRSRIAVTVATGVALLVPAAAAVGSPAGERGTSDRPALAALVDRPVPGAVAAHVFAGRIDELARHNGMSGAQLREALVDDATSWVDQDARVYYVEPVAPGVQQAPGDKGKRPPKPPPGGTSPVQPAHSSRPGSNRVIYLDFNGHTITGTAWNASKGIDPVNVTPYSSDTDATTFSAAEQAVITEVWQRVAEDYAAFDVNVTTVDPGVDAINRSSAADLTYGTRLLVDPTSWYQTGCGCGGVAYVGVYDSANNGYHQPALVFTRGVGNGAKNIAEAASHEIGHNLGLSHDGTAAQGYYAGHGAWAPIMGVGYSKAISQWSKGEYATANQLQDDYVVMGSNGAALLGDDHGNDTATATALATGTARSGVVTTPGDTDVFRVDLAAGDHTFTADPAAVGANLDIALTVRSSAGAVVGSWDPASGQTSASVATGLGASGTLNLPAGTYYVTVDGSGYADPLTTGYTDYGSIGAFTVRVD